MFTYESLVPFISTEKIEQVKNFVSKVTQTIPLKKEKIKYLRRYLTKGSIKKESLEHCFN